MSNITLTRKGREILTSVNTDAGSELNWVGYFGLAYVPDQSNFSAENSTLVGPNENGDYIYNLWQGDLFSEGHVIDSGRTLTLYDRNISSNFKYIYDKEKGCNRLVTWTCDGNADGGERPTYVRTGFKVYEGVQMGEGNNVGDTIASNIPCPAPLVYLGHNKSYTTPVSGWGSLTDAIGTDWPLDGNPGDENRHPMVSPDMRFYSGTVELSDETDFNARPEGTVDPFGLIASPYTRNGDTLDQYGEFVSVSNFNKGHGHVSSEGYGMNTQDSCHNMSQVTRLFPIGKYEIESAQPSTDGSNATVGDAKTIKYHIELNLNAAYAQEQLYEKSLRYQAPVESDIVSEEEQDENGIFVGKQRNSFKFNRIGIYAVKAVLRHFIREGDGGIDCSQSLYQVEISPDSTPELFAVINVDEQCMSDDGTFGVSEYSTDFALKLLDGEGGSICKNPEVYYNLAENEAITWYQNQLLATAGISEALVGLGVNVAHLMNREGGTAHCTGTVSMLDGTEYAPKGHTHDYMRNLVDGKAHYGAVRGVDSLPESSGIVVGEDSLVLGKNTAGCGSRLLVQGDDAVLDDTCADSAAIGNTRVRAANVNKSLLVGISPAYRPEMPDNAKSVECENVTGSIVTGNFYSVRNVKNSLVDGIAGSSISVGSANDIDASDTIAPAGAEMTDTVAVLDNAVTCPSTSKSLLVGSNSRFPYDTMGSLAIISDSNYANDDTLMSVEEFNAEFDGGSLFDRGNGWYILQSTAAGEHTIKVFDETVQGFVDVTLEESEGAGCTHYNAGIYVDAENHKVSYTPYYVRTDVPTPGTSIERTLVQGNISQYRANPGKLEHSILIGDGNHLGANMSESVLIGDGNDLSRFDLTECVIMGSGMITHEGGQENTLGVDWDGEDIKYVNHRLTNVKIWSSLGDRVLRSLAVVNDEFATSHYSDAMFFLDDRYNTPETYGIFPEPTKFNSYLPNTSNPGASASVDIKRLDSFFFIDPTRFTAGNDHLYSPVTGTHDWEANDYNYYDNNELFANKTKAEIAAMINKPDTPMIYTGGICLAGKPNGSNTAHGINLNEDNSGFIKLGTGVVPCAYIDAHPVNDWNKGSGNLRGAATIIPISVAGTTVSPYEGMALCIGRNQETDGTLHLELYRRLGEAPNIYRVSYNETYETFGPIDSSSAEIKLSIFDMVTMGHMSPVLRVVAVPDHNGKYHYAHLASYDEDGTNRILSFKLDKTQDETYLPSNRIDVTVDGNNNVNTSFNTDHPFEIA